MRIHALLIGLSALCLLAGCAATPPTEEGVFDIPRLGGIRIDGKAGDWGGRGFRVERMLDMDGELRAASDIDPRFRLGWNDRGLLALVTVRDDVAWQTADLAAARQHDCVEFFLADRRGGEKRSQVIVLPGFGDKPEPLRVRWREKFFAEKDGQKVPHQITAARSCLDGGYVLEVLLPWANLDIAPGIGRRLAFQLCVIDADGPDRSQRKRQIWRPAGDAHTDTMMMYTLRLSRRPSPPVVTAEMLEADRLARDAQAVMAIDVGFRPHVFSGPAFPRADFRSRVEAEGLLGPFRIETEFYDADFNRVTSADRPGRYGGTIRVTADDGRTVTRCRTLYRAPGDLSDWWWDVKFGGRIELPGQFGVGRAVADEHQQAIRDYVGGAVRDNNEDGPGLAILLAALSESKPAGREPGKLDNPYLRDRQWWVTLKRKLNGNATRFAAPFVCPKPIEGKPAAVVHAGPAAEAGMKPDAARKLDELLTRWAADSDEAFVACVVRHGVIVLHKAYGQRDGKPMTVETPSWMASLTKLISGTSIMMLADQGRVDLDATVDAYLPAFEGVRTNKPLTIRRLFTHTAGMWGRWGDWDSDFEWKVAEFAPRLQVGERFAYNGMDLALGGKVIEQVTGEALPQFYRKHLFDPLGMEVTHAANASSDAASVAREMAVLGQMLLNGGAYGDKRFLSAQTLARMMPINLSELIGQQTTQTWGVGCTWYDGEGLGKGAFGHGAASGATLRICPELDLVISMTRNSAGKNFAQYHPQFIKAVVGGIDPAR